MAHFQHIENFFKNKMEALVLLGALEHARIYFALNNWVQA